MPEFTNIYNILWGVVGIVIWSFGFWNIFKKPELVIPQKFIMTGGKVRRIFIFILGIMGWLFLTYSLSGPRLPLGYADNQKEVNDIFFVVDISRSM